MKFSTIWNKFNKALKEKKVTLPAWATIGMFKEELFDVAEKCIDWSISDLVHEFQKMQYALNEFGKEWKPQYTDEQKRFWFAYDYWGRFGNAFPAPQTHSEWYESLPYGEWDELVLQKVQGHQNVSHDEAKAIVEKIEAGNWIFNESAQTPWGYASTRYATVKTLEKVGITFPDPSLATNVVVLERERAL